MGQGMFGKRLAAHFSLLESSSLVLGPKGNSQVALTRMRMPNGFPGPTPHIPPEKAFSISVHLRRPDSIKGWGTWLDGRFHRVTEWDAGGIQILDMEHPNRRELSSGNVAFLSAQRYRFQSASSSNA
jgi:hypothetical protein